MLDSAILALEFTATIVLLFCQIVNSAKIREVLDFIDYKTSFLIIHLLGVAIGIG